ncbi:hypothetical protein HDF23_004761 [Mucilaginibacter lappiensis]|uniref:DUF3347 domain-containing protein n=1 Tax=Mucilaginibacter lappiensis TaxID=354630 RepID=A0ABR6PQY5_9SPHI|nr:hypothetical protein [Mucilaginibacter lappiensis]MBB6111988.1 hypothetical protein [Mucilaginibacter lappiensis]
MRSLFSRAILLTSFLTIAGILMTISRSSAQSSDNITAMTDKYWIDYESYIKSAVTEKDNHKSAAILNQMVKELTPKAAELNAKTAAWKKSHNQMEQIQLMSATQGNKHKVAALKYFMDPSLSMRSGQSEELHKAMKNMIDNLPVSKINTM